MNGLPGARYSMHSDGMFSAHLRALAPGEVSECLKPICWTQLQGPTLPSDAVPVAVNPTEKHLTTRLLEHQELVEAKRILRYGTDELDGRRILPFRFFTTDGARMVAESAGLEGFLFTERKFRATFGRAASEALLPNYYHYTLNLLHGAPRTEPLQRSIHEIRDSAATPTAQYERFMELISTEVEHLRARVRDLDPAHWSHWARMYHVFIRPFDVHDWRAAFQGRTDTPITSDSAPFFSKFDSSDFSTLRELSFNTLRWMGTFPIGQEGAKGDAGGSPFAMQRFEVASSLGNQEVVANHVRLAAAQGLRTVFELVLNHTAIDSDLVRFNPRLFVHTRVRPPDSENYYHLQSPEHGEYWIRYGGHLDEGCGIRRYFTDTLQLDLTNRDTRDLLIAQTKDLVRRYGVQAFRVDMAYKLRNEAFRECWGRQVQRPEPGQREFLEELITAVKVAFPGVAFIAEAFSGWDELSEDGFDLIYGLKDMQLRGGTTHFGWHEALLARSPSRIRQAIQRAEFLHWQEGGADMLTFWGQHDKPAFWRIFGEDWKWGAALLTIMRPGALSLLAGTEALYEDPCEEDEKVITFNRTTQMNWQGINSSFGQFQLETLRLFSRLERTWGKLTFELLPASDYEHWVGYLVRPVDAGPDHSKLLVLANTSHEQAQVRINNPNLGIENFEATLGPCGPQGVSVIALEGRSSQPIRFDTAA